MTDAHFTTKAQKFEQILTLSAIATPGGDTSWEHSDVYVRQDGDVVETLQSSGGGNVHTYCTFEGSYFDDVEGEAEAIIPVERALDWLAVATDGGRTEFSFTGPEDDRLAQKLHADGALNMTVELPVAEKALGKVNEELPERWTDDEPPKFLSPSGNPHQTKIDTTVEQVQRIIDAVDLVDPMDHYPVTVEGGDFWLAVAGTDFADNLSGELEASNVAGPDVHNAYAPGFEGLFGSTLSGDVQLQTTEGDPGHPLAVVQQDEDKTIRHVLAEVDPE